MTPVAARYYDGASSRQHDVLIYGDPPKGLRIVGDGVDFSCATSDVRVSDRLGATHRHLYFPDGAQCETPDNDGIDAILATLGARNRSRLLDVWESRLGYVAAALAITVVLAWAGVLYGIPAAAREVAFALPDSAEQWLGQDALAKLDGWILAPTRLPPGRQRELRALFASLTADLEGAHAYRLEFRSSERLGPNAFALPSQVIVMTDALVELAHNDAELASVLAHEIGHLKQRHLMRRLLQESTTALLMVALTGDITTGVAAALPGLVVESSYSRDFEREADDFALELMKRRGLPPGAFADMLLRLEEKRGGARPSGRQLGDYLSSHPATRERVERARAAQGAPR